MKQLAAIRPIEINSHSRLSVLKLVIFAVAEHSGLPREVKRQFEMLLILLLDAGNLETAAQVQPVQAHRYGPVDQVSPLAFARCTTRGLDGGPQFRVVNGREVLAEGIPGRHSHWSLTPGVCLIMLPARMTTRHKRCSTTSALTVAWHLRTGWAIGLVPLLLMLTLPAVVRAQFSYTNNYGIWAYTTNNGTVTITGCSGPGGAVVIPSEVNALPVTTIV
jgi:hypothetical protein